MTNLLKKIIISAIITTPLWVGVYSCGVYDGREIGHRDVDVVLEKYQKANHISDKCYDQFRDAKNEIKYKLESQVKSSTENGK